MAELRVRLLQPHDNRTRFHSGYRDHDRFFADFAGRGAYRTHVGTTFVAEERGAIVGFLNVIGTHILIDGLPPAKRKRLRHYPLPVLRLARLAVAAADRGRGIGLELVRVAFFLAHKMDDAVGCVGVVVDSKPEAVAFYERYGFQTLDAIEGELGDRPEPIPMFLPLAAIPREERNN